MPSIFISADVWEAENKHFNKHIFYLFFLSQMNAIKQVHKLIT